MSIRAECDICGAEYRLRDQMAGKRLPCKACATEFIVSSEFFDEQDEEDELLEYDGPRRAAGRHSSSAAVPLLIAGGGLFGLLVTIGIGLFFVSMIVSN